MLTLILTQESVSQMTYVLQDRTKKTKKNGRNTFSRESMTQ